MTRVNFIKVNFYYFFFFILMTKQIHKNNKNIWNIFHNASKYYLKQNSIDSLVVIEYAVEGSVDPIIDIIHDWLQWTAVIGNLPLGNDTGGQGECWGHYITTWFCNDLKEHIIFCETFSNHNKVLK